MFSWRGPQNVGAGFPSCSRVSWKTGTLLPPLKMTPEFAAALLHSQKGMSKIENLMQVKVCCGSS
jgi:hypothetical protein